MNFGISLLTTIPVRKEPADASEMTTQLLFGETYTVLEENGNWMKIKLSYDDYEGWIDVKQHMSVKESDLVGPINYVTDKIGEVKFENGNNISVCIGSSLPEFDGHIGQIVNIKYNYQSGSLVELDSPSLDNLEEIAKKYLNVPYLWGGRSLFGVDCSGFTQVVFKLCGVQLKRDAYQQAEQGETVNGISESKKGDLVFFEKNDKITHVGIILNDNQVIHASGKVRIDTVDENGICNLESGECTHKLKLIRRYC